MLSKVIHKVKLTVTTACNLKCDYCFVKPTNQMMGFEVAKQAIDFLLSSFGKDKLLSFYGGEPFINFNLIEKCVSYALELASKNKKNLTISICTNFTLVQRQHLNFIKKNNIKLIISLVGRKKEHDRVRKFHNHKGTHDLIVNRLPLLFDILPKENVGVSFCVFPFSGDTLQSNFDYLISLGFKHVNFEIIREYKNWSEQDRLKFVLGLIDIVKFVISEASKGKFIYLSPINWEVKYNMLQEAFNLECPFNYKLEVYPNGEMAFSPFLLNLEHKHDFVIGKFPKGLNLRFKSCKFDLETNRCRGCENSYFTNCNSDFGASNAYIVYRKICLYAAGEIRKASLKNARIREYIGLIKEKMCF